MPKEVIKTRDGNIEIRWSKTDESPEISIGVVADDDFVFVHPVKGGLRVIDSSMFNSLWISIESKDDATRLISALKSALKHLY